MNIPSGDGSYYSSPKIHSVNSVDSLPSLDESPLLLPLDKLSVFDLLDSKALATQISKGSKKLSSTVRKNVADIKDKARNTGQRLKKDADIDRLKEQFASQLLRLDRRMSTQNVVTAREKFTFSAGALNILYAGLIIGAYPQLFHVLYTAELAVLWPIRVYTYRKQGFQYYLVDLCYFVNLMTILYIWVFPNSVRLYMSCFALCYGTLCWAVITWRNSLVLHSVDKTTSTFIHVLPPCVFHVICHVLDDDFKSKRFPAAVALAKWDIAAGLMYASLAYAVWQSLYHYFITVKRKEKIKAGRVTSFEYLRKAYAKHPLGIFVNSLPEPYPVVAFTLIQYGYQMCTMILVPIWYSSAIMSTVFLTFIFGSAAYNGGSYYIEVFGKRFQKELQKLEAAVANFETENNVLVSPTLRPREEKDNVAVKRTNHGTQVALGKEKPAFTLN